MSSTAVEEMIGKISNYQAETKGLIHRLEQNIAFAEDIKIFLVQNNVIKTEQAQSTPQSRPAPADESPIRESPPIANTGQTVPLTEKLKSLNVGDKVGTIIAKVTKVGSTYTAKTKFGEKQVQSITVMDASNWGVNISLWEKDVNRFPVDSVVVINNAKLEEYKNEKQLRIEKGGAINLL